MKHKTSFVKTISIRTGYTLNTRIDTSLSMLWLFTVFKKGITNFALAEMEHHHPLQSALWRVNILTFKGLHKI